MLIALLKKKNYDIAHSFISKLQNSVSLWEGDGSLQGFPMEGYSGDGSRPPQMVSVPIPVYFEMLNYTQPVGLPKLPRFLCIVG